MSYPFFKSLPIVWRFTLIFPREAKGSDQGNRPNSISPKMQGCPWGSGASSSSLARSWVGKVAQFQSETFRRTVANGKVKILQISSPFRLPLFPPARETRDFSAFLVLLGVNLIWTRTIGDLIGRERFSRESAGFYVLFLKQFSLIFLSFKSIKGK